jgi:hypothetical protein
MEPERVRHEEGFVVGTITQMFNDCYEAVSKAPFFFRPAIPSKD